VNAGKVIKDGLLEPAVGYLKEQAASRTPSLRFNSCEARRRLLSALTSAGLIADKSPNARALEAHQRKQAEKRATFESYESLADLAGRLLKNLRSPIIAS
jgi:predicted transcriptional regulator